MSEIERFLEVARLHLLEGNHRKARVFFEKAREIDPSSAAVNGILNDFLY